MQIMLIFYWLTEIKSKQTSIKILILFSGAYGGYRGYGGKSTIIITFKFMDFNLISWNNQGYGHGLGYGYGLYGR